MLIVIASMEQELAGLRSQLRRGWSPGGSDSLPEGNRRISVNLGVVGIGTKAGVGLRSIFENNNGLFSGDLQRPVGLLLLGVAGAVGSGLETGDLVLSSRYYRPHLDENSLVMPLKKATQDSANPDDDPTTRQDKLEAKTDFLAPDPKLWQWAIAAGRNMDKPVVYADSLTVSDLVTSPNAKQAIERRYPVGIVNMEDYWAASVAQEAALPFISARAILDPAHQALPGYLPAMVGAPSRALLGLVVTPWRLPTLVGLSRQLGIAQHSLTNFALNFLTQVANATEVPSYDASVGAIATPDRSVP